MKQDMWRKNQ